MIWKGSLFISSWGLLSFKSSWWAFLDIHVHEQHQHHLHHCTFPLTEVWGMIIPTKNLCTSSLSLWTAPQAQSHCGSQVHLWLSGILVQTQSRLLLSLPHEIRLIYLLYTLQLLRFSMQQVSMWLFLELDSSLIGEHQAELDALGSLPWENEEPRQSPGNNVIRNLSSIMINHFI